MGQPDDQRVVVQFENLNHIETIGNIDHSHRLCVSAYVFYVPMWFKNLSYLSGFQTVPLPKIMPRNFPIYFCVLPKVSALARTIFVIGCMHCSRTFRFCIHENELD